MNLVKKWFQTATDDTKIQAFRFLFVGSASTLIDFLVFYLLNNVLGANIYLLAVPLGFGCGFIVNYLLSSLWVFDSKKLFHWSELSKFTVVALLGLGLNYLFIFLLLETGFLAFFLPFLPLKWINMLAKCIASGLVMVWNFIARKKIVFTKK